MIPNLAIFGRPIQEGTLTVTCINRAILRKAAYSIHFGPLACKPVAFHTTHHKGGDARCLRSA